MTADMLGASPQNVLLVGISGKCYELGHPLSAAVRHSVQPAIDELQRLGFTFRKKISPDERAVCGAITNIRFHSKRADKQRASLASRYTYPRRSRDYSIRRVTAGSIRIIRNVGKKIAAVATTAMTMGTAVRVSGS
jgi:hypothetical protein